jgi:hypothetical protein
MAIADAFDPQALDTPHFPRTSGREPLLTLGNLFQ